MFILNSLVLYDSLMMSVLVASRLVLVEIFFHFEIVQFLLYDLELYWVNVFV